MGMWTHKVCDVTTFDFERENLIIALKKSVNNEKFDAITDIYVFVLIYNQHSCNI